MRCSEDNNNQNCSDKNEQGLVMQIKFSSRSLPILVVLTTLHPRSVEIIPLWKRIKCFPSTLDRRIDNEPITGQFEFVFEEKSGSEITWLSWRHRLRKAPFSKCFPSTRKRKADVFKLFWFEERFLKPPISWRIRVDGRPNRRNKAAFSYSSGVVRDFDSFVK